ncbi:hypothetical protein Gogos_021993, partial [Gossypium gossypioides]|nr:hypothetical protein [Gossypium gossypioides]
RNLWNHIDVGPYFDSCIRNRVLVIVWLERETYARIQQRTGLEYANPLDILQALANGTKLLFKENILPSRGNTCLFSTGPAIASY